MRYNFGTKSLAATVFTMAVLGIVGTLTYGVRVEATLNRDDLAGQCPVSSPIFVQVKNYTFNTLRSVSFRMELFKGDVTENLLAKSSFSFNRIIPPLRTASACFSDEYLRQAVGLSEDTSDDGSVTKSSLSDIAKNVRNARKLSESHAVHTGDLEITFLH